MATSPLSTEERSALIDELMRLLPWTNPPLQAERFEKATESLVLQVKHNKLCLPTEWSPDTRLTFLVGRFAPIVYRQVLRCIEQPGSAVGMESATGMGRVSTQMSLNSVDWSERVPLLMRTQYEVHRIGEWVDGLMRQFSAAVKVVSGDEEHGATLWLDTSRMDVHVPSIDDTGVLSLKRVTAVTKHLPINSDGTSTLLRVSTRSGRCVTATKAKSFLTRRDGHIMPTRGDELVLGMRLPVVYQLPQTEWTTVVSLAPLFPKDVYLHQNEMSKAARIYSATLANHGDWTRRHREALGREYVVPYTRAYSLAAALRSRLPSLSENCIYPLQGSSGVKLPEKLDLDTVSGFFWGAYVAEGCSSKHQVVISNNDPEYRAKLAPFIARLNAGHHVQLQENKIKTGWTSTDVRVHSTLLSKVMLHYCGHLAHHKRIPSFAFAAPEEFVAAFLDGYFSGDGTVNQRSLCASSASSELVNGLQLLLTRFGVFTTTTVHRVLANNRGTPPENIHPVHTLIVPAGQVSRFLSHVTLTSTAKQSKLVSLAARSTYADRSFGDKIPGCVPAAELLRVCASTMVRTPNERNEVSTGLLKRRLLLKVLETSALNVSPTERAALHQAAHSHIFYDPITRIEEVQPTMPYVYDLTVAETMNFQLENGLAMRDTFHASGQVHSEMLHGVPRINELINATPNPKHSSMIVRVLKHHSWMQLLPNWATDQEGREWYTDRLPAPEEVKKAFHAFKHWTRFWFEHRTVADFLDYQGKQPLLFLPEIFEGMPSPEPYWYAPWREVFGGMRAQMLPTAEDAAVWYTLRLRLDKRVMVQYQLCTVYIAQVIQETVLWTKIKKRFGGWTPLIHCVASPDFEATIDVHVRVDHLPLLERIYRVARISASRQGQVLVDTTRRRLLFVKDVVFHALSRVRLTGVPGLEEINWRKRTGVGASVKDGAPPHLRWEVMTRGSALREVIVKPEVDARLLFTNHLFQVLAVLGIEAARGLFITEMRDSMGTVDEALFHTNVDSMMCKGTITPANRHGIHDVGPLVQASNEMSTQTLLKAASAHKIELLSGVSAAVMVGQHIRSGTGLNDVLWDQELWLSNMAERDMEVANNVWKRQYTTVPIPHAKKEPSESRGAPSVGELPDHQSATPAQETAPANSVSQLLSRLTLTTGHKYQMSEMEEV